MLDVPPAEPVPEIPVARPRLSLLVTALAAAIIVLFVVWIGWLHRTDSRVESVTSPEEALALVVSRAMELREGLQAAPAWERRLHQALMTDGADDLAQAIVWYEELAARSLDPLVDLDLAILYGEAGDAPRVRKMTEEWERRQEPLRSLADVVRVAYGEASASEEDRGAQREVLEALPPGWFSDRLAIAWARRGGDAELLAAGQDALAERAGRLFWRVRGLAGLEVLLIAGGLVALVRLWRRRRSGAPTVAHAALPPPWPGWLGIVVLVRGGAAGVIVILALHVVSLLAEPWVDLELPLVEAATWPLMYLPVLLLARRHLLQPSGLGFGQALGLTMARGGWRRLATMVLAVLAVAALGEWVLSMGSGALGIASHWSEWFDEELAWGDLTTVAASLAGSVVVAPVFEEVVFRGFLYATLRRTFRPGFAAFGSATLFAVAHGYGAAGFVDVLFSGWLWAWSFEKTGSVLPGVVAHAVTNLIVSLTILTLLR